MAQRVFIIPRWAGEPGGDFYPWLVAQMQAKAPHVSISILTPPLNPPVVGQSVDWLNEHFAPIVREGDIVMTHSVSAQMLLRFVAQYPLKGPIRVLSVAAWIDVDKPWETLVPWLARDYDVKAAKKSISSIRVLVSDNDRFTADYQKTIADFESLLGASSRVVPDADHFNRSEEPAVLEELLKCVGGDK